MRRTLKLYTAENGELKREFRIESGSLERISENEGGIDESIKRDRESRLLLQYDPRGLVRYYFYARSSGRPEQYIAEYELSGKASREKVLAGLRRDLKKSLKDFGYELDESKWESEALDYLGSPGKLDKPEISDDAKMAFKMSSNPELVAPDMKGALWLLFNRIGSNKSVTVSEGGYLEHRKRDEVLLQVDSMKRDVEPVKSSKERVDKKVVEERIGDARDALSDLCNAARSRVSGSAEVSDALNQVGVSDRLGIDVYSESKGPEVRSKYALLSFLGLIAIFLVAGSFFARDRLIAAAVEPIVLGEQVGLSTVAGGPYVIRGWWVLALLSIVVLGLLATKASSISNAVSGLTEAIVGGGTSERRLRGKAEKAVENLVDIRRRDSLEKSKRILRDEAPSNLAVDKGSRDSFIKKNRAVGSGIGIAAVFGVGAVFYVLTYLFSWAVFAQVSLVFLVIGAVVFVIGGVITLISGIAGGSSSSSRRGKTQYRRKGDPPSSRSSGSDSSVLSLLKPIFVILLIIVLIAVTAFLFLEVLELEIF